MLSNRSFVHSMKDLLGVNLFTVPTDIVIKSYSESCREHMTKLLTFSICVRMWDLFDDISVLVSP